MEEGERKGREVKILMVKEIQVDRRKEKGGRKGKKNEM